MVEDAYPSKHDLFPLPSVQIELSKVDGQVMLQQNISYKLIFY